MSQLTKISDEDIKMWGVFAPLSRFLMEINANLERINDSLQQVEEACYRIRESIDKKNGYSDSACGHEHE